MPANAGIFLFLLIVLYSVNPKIVLENVIIRRRNRHRFPAFPFDEHERNGCNCYQCQILEELHKSLSHHEEKTLITI